MIPFASNRGNPSGTKFWLSVFCGITCVKFLIAGITIDGVFSISADFDAAGAAAIIAALGAVYAGRRFTEARYEKMD